MKNKNALFNFLKEKSFDIFKISGIALIVCFLGSYAGSDGTSKNWRRLGIPITFVIASFFLCKFNPLSLILMLQYPVLCCGWGVPSTLEHNKDAGSSLGRFFFKICKNNNFWGNFCTRGFIAFLLMLSFLWVPIVNGNFLKYFICSILVILSFALFMWRNLGVKQFMFKGKLITICYSDVIAFGSLGLFGMLILI